MSTLVKVAETTPELNDAFRLRHDVFVVEEGKFGGQPLPGGQIVDIYDALPGVANIIAYDQGTPVGTLRINHDTGGGLPPEAHYDFSAYRQTAHSSGENTRFGSGGMLAIPQRWQRRRDVIHALFRTAIGVLHHWGVTHMLATVNHETVSLYGRLGFQPLAEAHFSEEIGNHVVPLATPFGPLYDWAFGELRDTALDGFWLDNFAHCFEHILLDPGEALFNEGDPAEHAYIVATGWVMISRRGPDDQELTLATLARGALFGELALIDDQTRSATARAATHCELIRLRRADFHAVIHNDERRVAKLLQVFAHRLRATDALAMVMAFAPQTDRVYYALKELHTSAVPDQKRCGNRVARIGPAELAKSAGVREHEVRRVLEMEKSNGHLDYGERSIRFLA